MGEGVWLQLSKLPPPSPLDSNRLAAYLAPLVSWNQLELYAFRVEAKKRQKEQLASRPPNASIQEAAAAVLREAEEGSGPTNGQRKRVPIRGLKNLEVDVTFNLRLADSLRTCNGQ